MPKCSTACPSYGVDQLLPINQPQTEGDAQLTAQMDGARACRPAGPPCPPLPPTPKHPRQLSRPHQALRDHTKSPHLEMLQDHPHYPPWHLIPRTWTQLCLDATRKTGRTQVLPLAKIYQTITYLLAGLFKPLLEELLFKVVNQCVGFHFMF